MLGFLSLICIALSAVEASSLGRQSGKTSLSFTRKINGVGAGRTIPDRDRARAQAMGNAGHIGQRQGFIDAMNNGVGYVAQVGVGKGQYNLLIDTGSANTWVEPNSTNPYQPGPKGHDTGNNVAVFYGSGFFLGEEWIDTVTLSPDLVINQQSIGVAKYAAGIIGADGVLGVGPVDLTNGTVKDTETVPTVVDNLKTQGTISEEVLGVFYVPAAVNSTGELTFGYGGAFTTSPVTYVPLTTTYPSSKYWGINQSVTYGSTTILSTTAGIVDTGTTLILLASDAFEAYQNKTGAVVDEDTRFLTISSEQYSNLEPLSFNIGGTTYSLTPDAQTWPRSLNSIINGTADKIYLVVSDIGTPSGKGFDFVNGYTFLERFYSVYDTTHGQVGFATTIYTDSVSNQN